MPTSSNGLRGVVAVTSAISAILGDSLTYRGIAIEELARYSSFEETAYLLLRGDLPNPSALNHAVGDLHSQRAVPENVLAHLSTTPHTAPMALLRSALCLLAEEASGAAPTAGDPVPATALRLLARMPVLVAAIHRCRENEPLVLPDPGLGEAENFLWMLTGRRPTPEAAHALDVALIVHADHELNASTFAARVTASTLADLHSAVIAALCALNGPLHGGADEEVMQLLTRIGDVTAVQSYVDNALQSGYRIPGFGHSVYQNGDPRAGTLQSLLQSVAEKSGDSLLYELTCRLAHEVTARTGLLPNMDFYSAPLYAYIGIPPYLYAPVFAMARVSGWIAHILEQYRDNRLIRPRAEYVGVPRRPYVQLHER